MDLFSSKVVIETWKHFRSLKLFLLAINIETLFQKEH